MIVHLLIEFELKSKEENTRSTQSRMSDTNDLMDVISASLGTTLDEVYQWLIDLNEEKVVGIALTEVVLMLAFDESRTAERSRNRLMRWRRGKSLVTSWLVSQGWASKATII